MLKISIWLCSVMLYTQLTVGYVTLFYRCISLTDCVFLALLSKPRRKNKGASAEFDLFRKV